MALTSAIASAYLSVSRWKLSTQPLPDKVIVIGAPHTSNWDGVFMAISMWKSGRSFSFLVKDSVVKAPVLGWFVKKIGAVPVERSAAHGLVDQVAQRIREADSFTLCITPRAHAHLAISGSPASTASQWRLACQSSWASSTETPARLAGDRRTS